MLKLFKDSLARVTRNWREYVASSLVFELIRIALLIPLISFVFQRILKSAKIFAVTNKNYIALFKHPLSITLLIILLFLVAFFSFYEMAYYFVLADNQMRGKEYTTKSVLKQIQGKWKYFLSLSPLLLIFYFILLPLSPFGLNSPLMKNINIPRFITDDLLTSTKGAMMYLAFLIIVSYITFRLVYTIYYFIKEEDATIVGSIKNSWKTTKSHTIVQYFTFLILFVISVGLTMVADFVLLTPLLVLEEFSISVPRIVLGFAITSFQVFAYLVSSLFNPLFVNIVVQESCRQENIKEKIVLSKDTKKHSRLFTIFMILIISVLSISNTLMLNDTLESSQVAIIAHRGFMDKGVENTITSLVASKEAGADMVEFDIQETKDGQFVVMHDYDLKRLAGISKNVYDMTLKEVQEVEIYQGNFRDRIPTLEEYIDVAKEHNIQLLIEVKPHGHESEDIYKNLVSLLKEKDIINQSVVQSLSLDALDAIKEIEPEIYTCYVLSLIIGNLPDSKHDFIALEDFSVTSRIIQQANTNYSGLLVWTVNDESLIEDYLSLDIVGLITNKPDVAINLRNK